MAGKKTKEKKEEGRDELSEIRGQLARALADYDNLVKRTQREREEFAKFASFGIIIKLLPVLDNLESAQEHLKDQGLAISLGEFRKVLAEEDLVEISPQPGEDFDANLHEAVETINIENGEGEEKAGKVAEVVLKGWMFKDGKVLRYAKVKVFGLTTGKNQN